jgi:hypothetical protein
MFSLLKSFLPSKESAQKVRRLTHPRDLRQGDIIQFSYGEVKDFSNVSFEVSQINTYIYGELCYPELILKDRDGNIMYMMVEEEDGDEYLAMCKKIQKTDVPEVLGEHGLAAITATGVGMHLTIAHTPAEVEGWLAPKYRKVDDAVRGAFVKGDARYLSEADFQRQEKFTSYILEDESEEYALEIESYSTGEVDVCATVYLDIDDITEMWPSTTPSAPTPA